MSNVQLTDGSPVPEDRSHTEIDPRTGQQKGYVVLSPEERAKGFVKPVRRSYIHEKCGTLTTMGRALCETYARNPRFYSGTFCCGCGTHFNLDQFHWEDGEPMDPDKQDAWAEQQAKTKAYRERAAAEELERKERAELARLTSKYPTPLDTEALNLCRLLQDARIMAILGDIDETTEAHGWGDWMREARLTLERAGYAAEPGTTP